MLVATKFLCTLVPRTKSSVELALMDFDWHTYLLKGEVEAEIKNGEWRVVSNKLQWMQQKACVSYKNQERWLILVY